MSQQKRARGEKREAANHELTRREFACAVLTPFVVHLTGCSGSDGPRPQGATPATGGATAASGGSATATLGAGGSTSTAAGAGPSSGGAGSGGSPGAGGSTTSGGGAPGSGGANVSGGAPNGGASNGGAPGTGGTPSTSGGAIPKDSVLLGLYPGDGAAAMKAAAQKLDFSWLKSGDSVLIKVAVNSQYTHPTTTCVSGVTAMIAELKARGAGKIIVADQAVVEHVRLSKHGRYGATSDMFKQNGMAAVTQGGAETHFFDDQPFDTGYFAATAPMDNHWPRGLYIPSIIKTVDHILYMPRIGTHTLAGNTQAHKMAIGWLRDDSRHDLHNDAQYYYEKYTEVNYTKEIRDRFRMAVTVSEKVLLHGGPDVGTPYTMSPVLVHASTSIPNHDSVGASILATLNRTITMVSPGTQTYTASSAPTANSLFAGGFSVATGAAGPWVDSGSTQSLYTAHAWEQGITKDRAIARGWALSGGKPTQIHVVADGAKLSADLASGLMTHGEGLYVMM